MGMNFPIQSLPGWATANHTLTCWAVCTGTVTIPHGSHTTRQPQTSSLFKRKQEQRPLLPRAKIDWSIRMFVPKVKFVKLLVCFWIGFNKSIHFSLNPVSVPLRLPKWMHGLQAHMHVGPCSKILVRPVTTLLATSLSTLNTSPVPSELQWQQPHDFHLALPNSCYYILGINVFVNGACYSCI